MSRPQISNYSTLQITLHWLVAALVISQILFGEAMVRFVDAAENGGAASLRDSILATGHYWSGIAILVLVVARLGLRIVRGVPPHAGDTPPLAALLANVMHWAFYGLLFIVPVSGLLAYYGLADVGDLHALSKPVFIVLVGLHAAAAMFNQIVRRDGTLARMLPVASR